MVMKLQIKVGDRTKNGMNRLTKVMNINDVRKLGFPNRLKWFTTRFKENACSKVRIKVISTLPEGEKLDPKRIPAKRSNPGSNKTGVSFSGRW